MSGHHSGLSLEGKPFVVPQTFTGTQSGTGPVLGS